MTVPGPALTIPPVPLSTTPTCAVTPASAVMNCPAIVMPEPTSRHPLDLKCTLLTAWLDESGQLPPVPVKSGSRCADHAPFAEPLYHSLAEASHDPEPPRPAPLALSLLAALASLSQ